MQKIQQLQPILPTDGTRTKHGAKRTIGPRELNLRSAGLVGDSGLKAEMSEKPESFDAFLSRWINECIQKLGEVDPVDREDIVEKKAAELVARSGNFAGFHGKLDEVALPYGGVKEYVRHLYQVADARGSTTRPTAHDGADD